MEAETVFLYDVLPPIGDSDSAPLEMLVAATTDILSQSSSQSHFVDVSEEDHSEADYIPLELAPSEPQPLTPQPAAERVWPWIQARSLTGSAFRSPLLQLHQEILDFCKFITPTEDEGAQRAHAVERVTECIHALWPDCKVQVFGSFATGLYLPTSDVDMVILESGCSNAQNGLRAFARVVRKRGVAQKLAVIARARVPIVKFVELESGISFDVSFDLLNGPEAAKFIQKQLATLPPLRPLCMVLKIFLQQRDLNEVYTGGIGSYALLAMLMAHLQLHPSRHSFNPLEANLGVLLVDFLNLYGSSLNVKEVGVSCLNGGRFYSKAARGFLDRSKPFLLSVEDPQAPDNDIGKNSYKFDKVRSAFFLAHKLLVAPGSSLGILGRIIRNDEILTKRKQLAAGDPVPGYFFNGKQEQKSKPKKMRPPEDEQKKRRKSQKHENDFSKRRKQEDYRKRKREEDAPEERKRPRKQAGKNLSVNEASSARPTSKTRPMSKWKRIEDGDSSRATVDHDNGFFGNDRQRSSVESTAFYKKVKYL